MQASKLDVPVDILSALTVTQLSSIVELSGHSVPSNNLSSQARKKVCLEILTRSAREVHPRDHTAEKFVARLRIRFYLKKLQRPDFQVLLGKLKFIRYVVGHSKDIISTLGLYVSRGACEGVYQKALMHVLRLSGYMPCMERIIPLYYPPKPYTLSSLDAVVQKYGMIGTNRLDIEVDGWIIELKAVEKTPCRANLCQLRNYLRHTEYNKGILVNFNQTTGVIDCLTCFTTDLKNGNSF